MSDNSDTTPPQFTPPIAGQAAPHVAEPHVPHVPIPHMGTSHAPGTQGTTQPQHQAQAQAPDQTPSFPPLPPGVTEEAIAQAIAHVEQTGSTEGIAPNVLAAACQRIEAIAAQQGVDLGASTGEPAGQANAQPHGPGSYVEAAVMDKKGTFERFEQQRDSLKTAVAEQRANAQKPYQDALNKAEGTSDANAAADEVESETMQALASAIKDLDPQTIAMINAMGVISNTPGVLKSILWIEIIRAMRNLISSEARQQVKTCMKHDAA